MKIRVEDVKKKQATLSEEEPAQHYRALVQLEEAGECVFTAPVRAQVSAFWEYDHVRVTGSVESAVRLSCSRCLAEYETPLASTFTIIYSSGATAPDDEEVELAEEDLIAASYEGDEIDLDEEIAEQVAMEVPYKPLCSEACKGLCSQCGADLNAGECGCPRGDVNLKMSALSKIKIEK